MKRFLGIMVATGVLAGTVAACSGNPNSIEQQQQQADTRTLTTNQPLPHFNYSQERQALIEAERAAADGTATTTFFFNQGVVDPIFTCPSIGLGIPDSASLSNPMQTATGGSQGVTSIGQMDPFGIYVPTSSSGTYVICVNSAGQEYLVRWEGFVQTVTAPAVWDAKTHSERLIGPPSQIIHTKK